MSKLTYFFSDAEFDGPVPGENSMISFGCAAYDEGGAEIGSFERNLLPLEGAVRHPSTMSWWETEPEAWAATQTNQVPPEAAIKDLVDWVRALPGDVLFCAAPLIAEGLWFDHYLVKFTDYRVAMPFTDDPLFVGDGLDVMSYAQAVLGWARTPIRKELPPKLLEGVNHTHLAIDDARGHAAVFFNARRFKTT